MYWDKKFETMPLEAMQDFQLKQLQQTVAWVYEKVPYYKNKLDDLGIKPQDIKELTRSGQIALFG